MTLLKRLIWGSQESIGVAQVSSYLKNDMSSDIIIISKKNKNKYKKIHKNLRSLIFLPTSTIILIPNQLFM